MSFISPAMSATREFLAALFKGLFPDRNVGTRFSYHGRRLTVLSAATTQIHRHQESIKEDVMPDTAPDGGPVERWGAIVGVPRIGATPARKSTAGRVRGTLAATANLDEELVHIPSGLRFKLASSVTIPAGLYQDADIVAIDTGSATRLVAGEVLDFVNTPANIETKVVLQKALDEDGFDVEPYGAYRRRMLNVFSDPAAGGTQSDYERWALEVPGIAMAKAYPNRAGFGTVDVAILHAGSGSARIPSAGTVATVLTYLKTKAPAHVAGTPGALRVLTGIEDQETIEITIYPDGQTQNAFDWNDQVAPTVIAYTAGTKTVQFSGGALPPSLRAGHRLSFGGVATIQDGTEFTIEAISGVDTVILGTAPTVNPAATDIIYSGGPLVTPIRKAILGHVNGENVYLAKGGTPKSDSTLVAEDRTTVGLEVIANGMGPANPSGVYGTWNGSLVRDVIRQIAMAKGGVRKTSLILPAADYDAVDYAFPLDTQIGVITAQRVLVRKAW